MSEKKVGYKNPPKHSQFKKGQSGNPKGRPKGSSSLMADLKEALEVEVTIREAGKEGVVTAKKGISYVLVQKALKGDLRAMNLLMPIIHEIESREQGETVTKTQSEANLRMLERYAEKIRKGVENE